jgi:muramoyltetrapeptide carboxypeptidase
MNRSKFLASLVFAGMGIPSVASTYKKNNETTFIVPPYLKKGDTIGITCPAGYTTEKDLQPAIQQLTAWGFLIELGHTVGKRDATFGGTDEERLADLQQMLDRPTIKAVMCARGGLVDNLNFNAFLKHPKWIIGFSDITVLHCHLHKNYRVASLHAKMCNSFPEDWNTAEPIQTATILSIRDALQGWPTHYTAVANENNRIGTAKGILVGGNLKTIESLAGSKSDINTVGKILFVEDTGEYLYSIDRMFWNLKRSGKLDKLAGLIVGGFKIKPSEDPSEEFGKNVQEIVIEKVKKFNYPVCFDFPVGHQKNNYALKCGVPHHLQVQPAAVSLQEIQLPTPIHHHKKSNR